MLSFIKDVIRAIFSPLVEPLVYLGVFWTATRSMFHKARVGVYVLAALIPLPNIWYKFHAYPFGKDFTDIIVFSILVGLYVHKKGLQRFDNGRLLIFFILVNYAALWNASLGFGLPVPITTENPLMGDYKNYVEMILLYFLVANAIETEEQQKTVAVIMASVVLFIAVREFRNFSPGDAFSYDKRVEGPFWVLGLGANHMGAFAAHYMSAFLGMYLLDDNRRRRWLYMAAILMTLHPLFFSYSRGGYLGVLAGVIFLGAVRKRSLLVMVFALLLAWQTLLPTTVVERISMTETAGGQLESSAAERVELWDHAIELFRQHPIFGIGFGAFGYTRPTGSLTDTHNFYLRMLSEQGVIGVGFFLIVLLAAFRSGWRLYDTAHTPFSRGLGLGFMACVVAVMVTNVFGDRWSYFVLGSYFFILWGLVDRGTFLARAQTAAQREAQWQAGAAAVAVPVAADPAASPVTDLKHLAPGSPDPRP